MGTRPTPQVRILIDFQISYVLIVMITLLSLSLVLVGGVAKAMSKSDFKQSCLNSLFFICRLDCILDGESVIVKSQYRVSNVPGSIPDTCFNFFMLFKDYNVKY